MKKVIAVAGFLMGAALVVIGANQLIRLGFIIMGERMDDVNRRQRFLGEYHA